MAMIVCCRNAIRGSSHISFFPSRDLFCEVVRRPENTHTHTHTHTHGELRGQLEWPASLSPRWSDQRVSPFAWETSGPLPFTWDISRYLLKISSSVQNYRPYILSQVPCRNMNILFASRIFCLWLLIGTYILRFFR